MRLPKSSAPKLRQRKRVLQSYLHLNDINITFWQGRCPSALGQQATDDNHLKANPNKPQTLAENETQVAEIPSEIGKQAGSPNVY